MLERKQGRVLLLVCCLILLLTTRVTAVVTIRWYADYSADSILEDENRRPLKGVYADTGCGHTVYDLVYLVWDSDVDGIEDLDCFGRLDGDSIVDSVWVGTSTLGFPPAPPAVPCSSGGFYFTVFWTATTGRYDTFYVIALNDTTWDLATYFGTSAQHNPSVWEIDSTMSTNWIYCTENNSWYTNTQIPGVAVFDGSSMAGNPEPGSKKVGMERIATKVDRGATIWNSLRVDNGPSAGCINDSLDIDSVKIYKEITGVGFDPDDDSLIGEAEWGPGPPDGGTATVTFSIPETLSTDSSFYYIAFDIASSANRSHCVSACVQDSSYIGTAPSDCLNGNFPFCSADVGLPVKISRFEAFPGDKLVILQWTTQTEIDNRGFYLYRALAADGDFARINEDLVPGAGNSYFHIDYEYSDEGLNNGTRYYYKLASITYRNVLSTHEEVVSAVPSKGHWRGEGRTGFYKSGANPSVGSVRIPYRLAAESILWMDLEVYDISGRLVKTLVAGYCCPGEHVTKWDGLNQLGQRVPTGIYFCRMQAGDFTDVKKMVLMR